MRRTPSQIPLEGLQQVQIFVGGKAEMIPAARKRVATHWLDRLLGSEQVVVICLRMTARLTSTSNSEHSLVWLDVAFGAPPFCGMIIECRASLMVSLAGRSDLKVWMWYPARYKWRRGTPWTCAQSRLLSNSCLAALSDLNIWICHYEDDVVMDWVLSCERTPNLSPVAAAHSKAHWVDARDHSDLTCPAGWYLPWTSWVRLRTRARPPTFCSW